MKKAWYVVGIIVIVLIIDQTVKIWVKTHMLYGEMIPIMGSDRAYIHFVENEWMAFGKRLDLPFGKLILSLFRITAAGLLVVFLRNLLRKPISNGLLVSFSFILAGALGNIIDSTFYGCLFSASYSHGLPAEFMPVGGGYSSLLYGKVVDMFYFPLFELGIPAWVPLWGGRSLPFFGPVFNIADVAITWGVIQVLLFHRRFFHASSQQVHAAAENNIPAMDDEIVGLPKDPTDPQSPQSTQ